MNVITIFNNQSGSKYYDHLLRVWVERVDLHNNINGKIKVLSKHDKPNRLKKFLEDNDVIWDIRNSTTVKNNKLGKWKNHHNISFKLYNLCQESEPFIFIDVDAFLLNDLHLIWEKSGDKPFIAINHQQIPNHLDHLPPFINSGVQIVSNPDFLNFYEIISKFDKHRCRGLDQSVLFTYFKKIGYDYTHPDIGPEWNCCASYTKLWKNNGKWFGRTIGLGEEYNVSINHYWYSKPWKLNCPLFFENWSENE